VAIRIGVNNEISKESIPLSAHSSNDYPLNLLCLFNDITDAMAKLRQHRAIHPFRGSLADRRLVLYHCLGIFTLATDHLN
jgi:hypothetical protein